MTDTSGNLDLVGWYPKSSQVHLHRDQTTRQMDLVRSGLGIKSSLGK